MQLKLAPYSGKKICIAVSGGRDSMALLHYFNAHKKEYAITLSALNCDHCIRGEESKRDSDFVKDYCQSAGIPLTFFSAEGKNLSGENEARDWRLTCYSKALEGGADLIATAHHLSDNAETVLFNLARGTALAGMTGITDRAELRIIRPMLACSTEEIQSYVQEYGVPFVQDSTNFTGDYTRNKLRHNVLPALEEAVPGATAAIYRFSRLAAEDEEYMSRQAQKLITRRFNGSFVISACTEPALFKRALAHILRGWGVKDYTSAQIGAVFELQQKPCGKAFEFLKLTAVREEGGIAISLTHPPQRQTPFKLTELGLLKIRQGEAEAAEGEKALKFDMDKIPPGAVIRCRREGDRFTKFGGVKKSLSNYFTDEKIPQSLRDEIPLVCFEGEVLIVCGAEISDLVKVTAETVRIATVIYPKLK